MAIKLQIRRDIKTNWDGNSGVILLSGEIGYETDTRNMKIGDGTTVWSSLKYQAPYYTGTNSSLATTTLSVDQTNNRVGIGTTSPSTLLHVKGSAANGQVRIETTGDIGSGSPCYAGFYGTSGRSGYFGFGGNANILDIWNDAAGVLRFGTNNAERMRIDSAGLVGIATTSPAGTIGVVGDAVIGNQASTGTSGTMRLVSSAGINYIQSAQAATASSAAPLVISAFGGGAEWMRITSSGASFSGTTTSSGAMTVTSGGLTVTAGGLTVTTGGLNVAAGSVTLPSNTVAIASLANMAAAGVLGATAAGAVTALTTGSGGTAKTALGLGAAAYTDGPYVATGNQVGQIAFVSFDVTSTGTDAGVYTGVTSSSTTGPKGGASSTAPTYVSFGGTTTWSKGGATYYVRPNQGTWTCIQTNNTVSNSTVTVSMICIRTA